MAVSKTKPVEAVQEAYAAGQRVFGENYVQVGAAGWWWVCWHVGGEGMYVDTLVPVPVLTRVVGRGASRGGSSRGGSS